jgi:putative transposase
MCQRIMNMLLSYPPRLSVAKLAQYIKGKTSRKLLQEYSEIRKKFWSSHIWARGYIVVSTGNVTDKLIAKYIKKQDIEQKDDDFKISDET